MNKRDMFTWDPQQDLSVSYSELGVLISCKGPSLYRPEIRKLVTLGELIMAQTREIKSGVLDTPRSPEAANPCRVASSLFESGRQMGVSENRGP